jgi:hypothetical protein
LLTPQQSSKQGADLGGSSGAAAATHTAVDLHPVWPGLLQPRAAATRPSSRLGRMRNVLERKAASCPAAMGPPPSAGPSCSPTHSLAGSTQQAPPATAAAVAVEAALEREDDVAAAQDPLVVDGTCIEQEMPCRVAGLTRADISPATVATQEARQPVPGAEGGSPSATPIQGAHSTHLQHGSKHQGAEAAARPSSSGEQQAGALVTLPTPSVVGSSLSVDRSKPVRAMVGVRAAWVSTEHRRQGIATQLLEAAR